MNTDSGKTVKVFTMRSESVFMIGQNMQLESGDKKRRRQGVMSPSELMTILINFHQSHYKDFKSYYLCHVHQHLRKEFPNLLSYSRFL